MTLELLWLSGWLLYSLFTWIRRYHMHHYMKSSLLMLWIDQTFSYSPAAEVIRPGWENFTVSPQRCCEQCLYHEAKGYRKRCNGEPVSDQPNPMVSSYTCTLPHACLMPFCIVASTMILQKRPCRRLLICFHLIHWPTITNNLSLCYKVVGNVTSS